MSEECPARVPAIGEAYHIWKITQAYLYSSTGYQNPHGDTISVEITCEKCSLKRSSDFSDTDLEKVSE
jgi:hypothetical protein